MAKVNVVKRKGRPFYQAEWTDPTTGRKRSMSTGETRKRQAERFASRLEERLIRGETPHSDYTTWRDFRKRYESEVLSGLSPRTAAITAVVFKHVETIIDPKWLRSVDETQIGRMTQELRRSKLAESTIKGYLSHLRSALSWAKKVAKLIPVVPPIKLPTRTEEARGRPITQEEFERILAAIPACCSDTEFADSWSKFLWGLWFSGLRISEALMLHWNGDEFRPELSGRHPMFWISGRSQKSGKDQLLPMAPEFVELLHAIPDCDREGFVFDLPEYPARRVDNVSSRICSFGEKANVKVAEKRGKVKFASAHDFRRSFGVRWAMRVRPFILKQMMRHKSIRTTEKFYALIEADHAAAEIWSSSREVRAKTDTFTDT